MRIPAQSCSTILALAFALYSGHALAVDAGAPAAASAPPPAPSAAAPGPAKAAKPGQPKPPTVKPKPAAAKPTAKDKAATLKKKPRAAGQPHAPDANARRAVAGPATDDSARGVDSPEISALRDAERELFGPPPSRAPQRSGDAPLLVVDRDRPSVHSSGLPPPVNLLASPAPMDPKDTAWVSSLSLPDVPVRWNPRVLRYLEFYKTDPRGRSIAAVWLKRSGTYEAQIRKVLRANNVPEDLVWVALVESGFNTHAYSGAGAAGLWQFMPATGRLYGLVIDRWVDERLDPDRSTIAAARFLSDLNRRFGSWELALAAYNMGLGGLLAAVRKYNTNDFWELSRFEAGLPWETTLYVPKIVALAVVAKNPAAFGLEGVVKDPPVAFDTVDVAPGVSLAAVASAGQVDIDRVEALNPQMMLSRTPPQAPASAALWTIRVPVGTADKVNRNLVKARAQDRSGDRYTVRQGDTIAEIARAHAVNARQLAELNGLDPDDVPKPGTTLALPANAKTVSSTEKPVVAVASELIAPPGYRRVFYKAIAGDTVQGVADALGISSDDLRRWNLLDPIARLQDGMWLMAIVPATRDLREVAVKGDNEVRLLVTGTDRFFEHHEALRDRVRSVVIAKPGDTWNTIATRAGMTVGMIERVNRKSRHTRLEPGERVIVYTPTKIAGAPARVQPGPAPKGDARPATPPKPDDLPELPELDDDDPRGKPGEPATP